LPQALLAKFSTGAGPEEDSDYGFSFGNLFRCICCPRPRADLTESKFEMVLEKLENIERAVVTGNQVGNTCTWRLNFRVQNAL